MKTFTGKIKRRVYKGGFTHKEIMTYRAVKQMLAQEGK